MAISWRGLGSRIFIGFNTEDRLLSFRSTDVSFSSWTSKLPDNKLLRMFLWWTVIHTVPHKHLVKVILCYRINWKFTHTDGEATDCLDDLKQAQTTALLRWHPSYNRAITHQLCVFHIFAPKKHFCTDVEEPFDSQHLVWPSDKSNIADDICKCCIHIIKRMKVIHMQLCPFTWFWRIQALH